MMTWEVSSLPAQPPLDCSPTLNPADSAEEDDSLCSQRYRRLGIRAQAARSQQGAAQVESGKASARGRCPGVIRTREASHSPL